MVNVILSVVLELLVLAAIGVIIRRIWRRTDRSADAVQGLLYFGGLAVAIFGAFVAMPAPPMMLVVFSVGMLMCAVSMVMTVWLYVTDWIGDRHDARDQLLSGFPPRPRPMRGGWAIALGVLTFVASMTGVDFAEVLVTWAAAVTAIASNTASSAYEVPTQTTVGFLAASGVLGAVVASAVQIRALRKIRQWEDLTEGIERRVRVVLGRATDSISADEDANQPLR